MLAQPLNNIRPFRLWVPLFGIVSHLKSALFHGICQFLCRVPLSNIKVDFCRVRVPSNYKIRKNKRNVNILFVLFLMTGVVGCLSKRAKHKLNGCPEKCTAYSDERETVNIRKY